ncbi:hypothetical protein ACOME3_010069 [Neoechinorhynchus agilis]
MNGSSLQQSLGRLDSALDELSASFMTAVDEPIERFINKLFALQVGIEEAKRSYEMEVETFSDYVKLVDVQDKESLKEKILCTADNVKARFVKAIDRSEEFKCILKIYENVITGTILALNITGAKNKGFKMKLGFSDNHVFTSTKDELKRTGMICIRLDLEFFLIIDLSNEAEEERYKIWDILNHVSTSHEKK